MSDNNVHPLPDQNPRLAHEWVTTASGTVAPLPDGNPRFAVWDTLTEHFGSPRTKTERSMFGRVVAEMLEAGATAEETRRCCEYVLANFDSPSVNAVPKWLSRALSAAPKQRRSAQEQALDDLRRGG